ncbi:MAG: restriction endonuclease subunit S [Spirochaetaceae bacterium]|nr:restriction endonuclease subunit S [Spirochaetaceae bacterium]
MDTVERSEVMSRIHAYPSYRDSGFEWLNSVPEHWEERQLKQLVSYRTSNVDKKSADGESPVRLCNYTDVYYHDRIRAGDGDFMRATALPNEIERFRLQDGDVLITKDSEDWRDIAVPALIEETADDFVCGYHLGILRPGPLIESSFLFRAMQCVAVNQQVQVAATGVTRYGVPNGAVGDVRIPLPPLNEQREIAAFLDRETERIDSLIVKKQLLIERLQEFRTALITRTVTRGLPTEAARAAGLDPSPRLKPSGVEWLGDVPEHWDVRQLGRIGTFSKCGGGTKDDEVEDGIPCVRYGDLYTWHRFSIETTRAHISEESAVRYTPIRYGDLLFAGSGETIEEIGKSAVNLIAEPVYGGGDIVLFRPTIEINASFLGYSADCTHAVYQKSCMGRGVTVMHIYASELKRLFLAYPPVEEQRAIAIFLDREMTRIDALRSRVNSAIERLEEYRTALITAAVTGKIDVRGEVSVIVDLAE